MDIPVRLTCAVLMTITLSACATPDQRGAGTDRDVQAAEDPRLTEVPGVLVGMTHKDVVSVLGTNFIVHDVMGPYMTLSFPYIDDGARKFHIVGYWEGKVSTATTGRDRAFIVL